MAVVPSTAPAGTPSRAVGGSRSAARRGDVQGLRAFAVLVVVGNHLFAMPSGGFAGVDVFFVISGFLITSLLLGEQARTGRISLAGFYRRRARRILPMATLVAVLTVAAAWALYPGPRARSIVLDGVASLAFVANWRSAATGTDYMNADGPVSPLQHYWSLAVEEQFYLVWPLLLIVALGLLARRPDRRPAAVLRALSLGLAAVVAGSFALAVAQTAATPTVAYFSTLTRVWELGVGALVALGAGPLGRLGRRPREVLAAAGLVGLAAGVLLITADAAFPGPWAALPVLACAAVLVAGLPAPGGDRPARPLRVLTHPAARYLGDISFSLYLWHFPLVVLGRTLVPQEGPLFVFVVLTLTLGLSVASYHLVEDPVRRSRWLDPGRRRPRRRRRLPLRTGLQAGGLTVVSAVAVALCVVAVRAPGPPPRPPLPQPAGATPSAPGTPAPEATPQTPAEEHRAAVTAALAASQWPQLDPPVDRLGPEAKAEEWVVDGCLGEERNALDDPVENAERCSYGDPAAPREAVLVGDSVAISYAPGLRAALEPAGFRLHVYSLQQCPAALVEVRTFDGSPHRTCADFQQWVLDRVEELRPDLVVLASAAGTVDRLVSGAEGRAAMDEWAEGSAAMTGAVAAAAADVAVLDPPPGGRNLQDCATSVSSPADCVTALDDRFADLAAATRRPGQPATVRFVDSAPLFCSAEGRCPPFVGGTPVYVDNQHLTDAYSAALGPALADLLVPEP